MDPILIETIAGITKGVAELLVNALSAHDAQTSPQGPSLDTLIQRATSQHLQELAKWSSSIPLYGLGAPQETSKITIALDVSRMPRRFRRKDRPPDMIGEAAFLNDSSSYILLGDPGAGKTTTVKRLIQLLLTSGPASNKDNYQMPILIRLRQFDSSLGIYRTLARTLGIPYSDKFDTLPLDEDPALSPQSPPLLPEARSGSKTSKENTHTLATLMGTYIGSERIETALPRILDGLRCVIFVPGRGNH